MVVGSCGQWFGNMNPDKPLDFSRYYFPLFNYCSTKVLNMLFTVDLNRRLKVRIRELFALKKISNSLDCPHYKSLVLSRELWNRRLDLEVLNDSILRRTLASRSIAGILDS